MRTDWTVGDIVRVRDGLWRIHAVTREGTCVGADLDGLDALNAGRRVTLLLPFERLASVERDDRARTARRGVWRQELARTAARCIPADAFRDVADTTVELHGYQLEPALALVGGRAARVLVADEVGLGKTIQAGLALRELRARGEAERILVIVPAGLREQWQGELRSRLGLSSIVLDWSELARRLRECPPGSNPWAQPGIGIASIDFVKQPEVFAGLAGLTWDVLVVDEAHTAAGTSQRGALVNHLARRARRLVLLSATPHSGDDRAFEALTRLGALGAETPEVIRDRMLVFRRTAASVGARHDRRTVVLRVRLHPFERHVHELLASYVGAVWKSARGREGRAARLAMLVLQKRALSTPWALLQSVSRRRALLVEQPPQAETAQSPLPFERLGTDVDEDDAPAAVLAARGLASLAAERSWLARLADALHAAVRVDRKLERLHRLVARSRQPLIVFTEYRDTLSHVARRLDAVSTVAILHGALAADERRRALARFLDGTSRVLLATDAASEGLNLQDRCSAVIHVELPWNPNRLEQRVGRVDRIGQRRRVHDIHLVGADSREPLLLERLRRRATRIAAALERAPIESHPACGPGYERLRSSGDRVERALEPAHLVRALSAPRRHPDASRATPPDVAPIGTRPLRLTIRRRRCVRRLHRHSTLGWGACGRTVLATGCYFVLTVPIVDQRRGRAVEEVATVVAVRGSGEPDGPQEGRRAARVWEEVGPLARREALVRAEARLAALRLWTERAEGLVRHRGSTIARLDAPASALQQPGLFDAIGWTDARVPPERHSSGNADVRADVTAIRVVDVPRLVLVLEVRP